ncbi:MAG: YraN family protein [Proteobacteria bacterium]|nr:YraN family protein [Pseudomonadota bacterium]
MSPLAKRPLAKRSLAKRPVAKRRTAERRGRLAERMALALLRLKGYRILEQRYKTPVGEIDIIAQRKDALIFIEVKARRRMRDAIESIGARQRQRITRAAEAYLARHPAQAGKTCRFDAILVAPGRLPRHMIDAWSNG